MQLLAHTHHLLSLCLKNRLLPVHPWAVLISLYTTDMSVEGKKSDKVRMNLLSICGRVVLGFRILTSLAFHPTGSTDWLSVAFSLNGDVNQSYPLLKSKAMKT